jgi:CheY-like chemotaxis protein
LQINWDYPKKPVFPKSESNKKILLVEDNLINEKVAVATLSRLGFVVDTAPNGLVALQKFKESTYDLIFMDIQMPEMDGIEATIQIREYERVHALTHPTPIIALTAISHPKDKERCKLVGMNDYIVKPFRIDDLARILTIRNT